MVSTWIHNYAQCACFARECVCHARVMLQYSRAVLCYETVLCAVIFSVLFEVSLSNIASPFKVHFFSEGWQGRTRIEIQALLRHACIMNSNRNIRGHFRASYCFWLPWFIFYWKVWKFLVKFILEVLVQLPIPHLDWLTVHSCLAHYLLIYFFCFG